MPFITTPERYGMRKGMLQMIEKALRIKFGEEGAGLMPHLNEIYEADKMLAVGEAILKATTLQEVHRALAEATAPAERFKKSSRGKRRK